MKTETRDDLMEGRCGARSRAGTPCRKPAMPNGRCRFHGGLSTGPRTAEGLARMRAAKTRHGAYSAEAAEFRLMLRQMQAEARRLVELV